MSIEKSSLWTHLVRLYVSFDVLSLTFFGQDQQQEDEENFHVFCAVFSIEFQLCSRNVWIIRVERLPKRRNRLNMSGISLLINRQRKICCSAASSERRNWKNRGKCWHGDGGDQTIFSSVVCRPVEVDVKSASGKVHVSGKKRKV